MDLSPLIPGCTILIGLAYSAHYGKECAYPEDGKTYKPSILIAIMVGLFLTFLTSIFHTECIENLNLCKNGGDTNIGYWLYPTLAIPLFLIVSWAFYAREISKNS